MQRCYERNKIRPKPKVAAQLGREDRRIVSSEATRAARLAKVEAAVKMGA